MFDNRGHIGGLVLRTCDIKNSWAPSGSSGHIGGLVLRTCDIKSFQRTPKFRKVALVFNN
jgi:hypothetical protein